jgi:hypothetical protein
LQKAKEEDIEEDHDPSLPLPLPLMCMSNEYSHQQFVLKPPQPDDVTQSNDRRYTLT